MEKKTITQNLKELLNNEVGFFCTSLKNEDFISIGASLFIGVKKLSTGYIQVYIANSEKLPVTHYKVRKDQDNGV